MAILYKSNETDFNHLGLGPLNEAVSILVIEERNGIFELEMTYPTEGSRFSDLKLDRLIKSDAGHELKNQRFKIIRITKPIDGIVTVNAEHVSYLTQDLALRPTVNYSGAASQALNTWATNIVDNHPFMVASDITTTGSGSWSIKDVNSAREALGGVSGSLLETYGGEYRFDNYSIRLMAKRGINSGALIAYGRNLTDLTQEESIADTYTSVYPYAVYQDANNKEVLLTLPEYFVDSDYVNNYARRKIKTVNFSEDEIKTVAQLRNRVKTYIKANGIGIPKVNLKIKYVDLTKTLDYKDVAILEQINVCDNVTVYFEKFDVNTNAKIIKTVWNDLLKQYDSIEVGDARASLSQQISATVDGKLETIAQQVNTIQLSADGKNVIHRGPIEPPPGNIGDMWYQPDGEFEIFHQWDGSVWKVMLNTRDLDSVKRESEQNKIDLDAEKIRIDNTIIKADQAIADAGFVKLDLIQVKQTALNAVTEAQKATGNVNTISTRVDTLSQTITTKADNTTVNDLTGVVDRHTLDIAKNARDVSLKLTSAQVDNAITSKGYATTTALDATSKRLGLSITEVSTDLANLEIGGRNLIKDSFPFLMTGSDQGNANTSVLSNNYVVITPVNDGNIYNNGGLKTYTELEQGEIYTFSIEISTTHSGEIYFRPSENLLIPYPNTNGKWERVSYTYIQSGVTQPANRGSLFGFNGLLAGIKIKYKGLKLEKGNKSTGYSVAPEEMATVERAVQIEANLNGLQTTVSNKADKSQITQLAKQWTQTTALANGHTGQISNLGTDISLRVRKDDLISQINVQSNNVLIQSGKLYLDAASVVFSGKAFIPSASITSLTVDKLNGGTANFANFNAININASSISTGILEGIEIKSILNPSDFTNIKGGRIRSEGVFDRTFTGGKTATYNTYTESWNGVYRSGLISKKANGSTLTELTRWLVFSDKTLSTQREVHSGSDDYKGARFIDFFADETLTSNVYGQGMHIYSGQSLLIQSKYDTVIKSGDGYYTEFKGNGVEILADGASLNLKKFNAFSSTVGSGGVYIALKASDGAGHGLMGITSNNLDLQLGTTFGKFVKLRSVEETHIMNVDGTSFNPLRASKLFSQEGELDLLFGRVNVESGVTYIQGQTDVMATRYKSKEKIPFHASEFRLTGDGRIVTSEGVTYIQGNTEVRATKYNSGVFVPMKASSFIQSSSKDFKTNIEEYKIGALSILNNLKVVQYDLISNVEDGINNKQVGFISEDNGSISSFDKKGVDIYKTTAIIVKSVQKVSEFVFDHDTRLMKQELELLQLKQEIKKIKNKMGDI